MKKRNVRNALHALKETDCLLTVQTLSERTSSQQPKKPKTRRTLGIFLAEASLAEKNLKKFFLRIKSDNLSYESFVRLYFLYSFYGKIRKETFIYNYYQSLTVRFYTLSLVT